MLFIKRLRLTSSLTRLFKSEAKTFSGLYSATSGALDGKSGNRKALNEFYKRISFISGYEKTAAVLSKNFPAADLTPENAAALKLILLKATQSAGITCLHKDEIITLTKENVLHYDEWDNGELYPGSRVKIIFPAWYVDGKLIEKGFCSLID
ncbi:MAG: hypothetical protein IK086_04690 [Clostridia bacterium]|nr:hypothetical protein [Clostridia bacterium]